jgi:ELWxxDGT repeat protein
MKTLLRIAAALLSVVSAAASSAPSRVIDLNPSTTLESVYGFDDGMGVLDGLLVFAGNNGALGVELWRTDGTAAGTQLVMDIEPGSQSSTPGRFRRLGPHLYFSATTSEHGNELWRTDGTTAGTVRLTDLNPGALHAGISSIEVFQGRVWFTATDPVHGREAYATDGTTTIRMTEFPGEAGPFMLAATGVHLYAFVPIGASTELHVTDGASPFVKISTALGSYISGAGALGNLLVFGTSSSGIPARGVWVSDGTVTGTRALELPFEVGKYFTAYQGRMYFSAYSQGTNGWYRTDGTTAGTVNIPLPAEMGSPSFMTVHAGFIYLSLYGPEGKRGLWRSDGTTAETELVHPFPGRDPSIDVLIPNRLFEADGLLYMTVYEPATHRELWILEPPDRIPEPGAFAPRTATPFSQPVRSGPWTMAGINTASPISVSGGEYSIGCTTSYTAAAGFIRPGQWVCVRHQSAATATTTTITTLTVGGVAAQFQSTTAATAAEAQVASYYEAILRRAPEPGAQEYWQQQDARMRALGADPAEVWYSMAQSFFASGEYLALGRNPTEYVRDLYEAFFRRAADDAGLAHWTGLLAQGMPRDVVLLSFLFSPEFTERTRLAFGGSPARPEVDVVMDFYRGLLGRLPDNDGFNYWVGRFRAAQCAGSAAVYEEVESISSGFLHSPEYGARGRNDGDFVGDMYNAFMRRGGELSGVQYWTSQLAQGRRDRDGVRRTFLASTEFASRVAAVVAQPCLAATR